MAEHQACANVYIFQEFQDITESACFSLP